MNLRIFQKFDPWGTHRLVWDKKPGETPPPAPAEAPTTLPQTPEEVAAAAAQMATERAGGAAASRQAEPEAAAAAEAALAALGIEVKTAPPENQPPVTIEQLEIALKKGKAEQLLALDASLNAPVPDKEKEAFQKKYKGSSDSLDLALIGKNISAGKLNIRELVIFSHIMGETPNLLSGLDDNTKKALEGASQRCKALQGALEKQVKPKFSPEQVDAVFKKETYQEAYKIFLTDPNKQAEFLAAITDENDRAVIEWAITAEPTLGEKTAIATKFKDLIAKNDPAAIGEAVASDPPRMNHREGMIAKTILADLQAVAEESAIPDSVKGLGFMAILEKLIDQLSKLAEKISGALEKAFKKKDEPSEKPRFAKSPLGDAEGKPNKFALARTWERGKGVEIAAPTNTPIFAVGGGTVKNLENNKVELVTDNGRKVVYQNIIIKTGLDDTKVNPGAEIGKTGTLQTLTLQYFNDKNDEEDPAPLLVNFIETRPTAQQETVAAGTQKTESPPAAAQKPATGPPPPPAVTSTQPKPS